MSVDSTSKVHVVEEIGEGSVVEMHIENNMLRESAKEIFVVEDCNKEITVKEF